MTALGADGDAGRLDPMAQRIHDDLGLPRLTLDPGASTDQVLKRAGEHAHLLRRPLPDDVLTDDDALRRTALYLKSVLNVFGNVGSEVVSAEEYSQWLDNVRAFERTNGYRPGELHGGAGGGMAGAQGVGGRRGRYGGGGSAVDRPPPSKTSRTPSIRSTRARA